MGTRRNHASTSSLNGTAAPESDRRLEIAETLVRSGAVEPGSDGLRPPKAGIEGGMGDAPITVAAMRMTRPSLVTDGQSNRERGTLHR